MIGAWRQRALARLRPRPSLLAVLMKPRNGERWTPEDRAFLRRELKALTGWMPGMLLFLLPGGLLLLPAYAWLLDRRRTSRPPGPARGL